MPNQEFLPSLQKILNITRKTIHRKIRNTKNKIENYFGNTLDKHAKRIYGTSEGILIIYGKKNCWIENQKKS